MKKQKLTCEEKRKLKNRFLNIPVNEWKDYKGNAERLKSVVKNKEIHNIAVMGSYGAGKSSLIKTYESRYGKKWWQIWKRKNSMRISLASFNDQNIVKNDNSPEDSLKKRNIEKSIIQQMLYRVDTNKLSASRLQRIKTKNSWSFWMMLGGVLLTLLSTCLAVFTKHNSPFTKFANGNEQWLWSFILIAIMGGILSIVAMSFRYTIKRIKYRDIEAEMSVTQVNNIELQNHYASLINAYLDEVIYFFSKTNYSVVYIEDLDRTKDREIFNKLRELNFSLNNSNRIRRKITFVFCLGVQHDIFKDQEELSKFFDEVINVRPFLNINNFEKTFIQSMDLLKIDNTRINEPDNLINFAKLIGPYITNKRTLNNIFKDYIFYVRHVCPEYPATRIFAMMAYKSLFPQSFSKLEQNKKENAMLTILAKVLSLKTSLNKVIAENIEVIEKERLNSVIELRMLFFGYYIKHFTSGYSSYLQYAQNLIKDTTVLADFTTESITEFMTKSNHTNMVSIEKVKSEFQKDTSMTFEERFNNIIANQNGGIAELKIEKQRILSMPIKELLEKYKDSESIDDWFNNLQEIINNDAKDEKMIKKVYDKGEIQFLRMCFENGFITADYKDIVFGNGSVTLTGEDKYIYQNLVHGHYTANFSTKDISQPYALICELRKDKGDDFFLSAKVLNNKIIAEIFSTQESDDTLEGIRSKIIELLKDESDPIVKEFLVQYLADKENQDQFESIIVYDIIERKDLYEILESAGCVDRYIEPLLSEIKDAALDLPIYLGLLKNKKIPKGDLNILFEYFCFLDDFKDIAEFIKSTPIDEFTQFKPHRAAGEEWEQFSYEVIKAKGNGDLIKLMDKLNLNILNIDKLPDFKIQETTLRLLVADNRISAMHFWTMVQKLPLKNEALIFRLMEEGNYWQIIPRENFIAVLSYFDERYEKLNSKTFRTYIAKEFYSEKIFKFLIKHKFIKKTEIVERKDKKGFWFTRK